MSALLSRSTGLCAVSQPPNDITGALCSLSATKRHHRGLCCLPAMMIAAGIKKGSGVPKRVSQASQPESHPQLLCGPQLLHPSQRISLAQGSTQHMAPFKPGSCQHCKQGCSCTCTACPTFKTSSGCRMTSQVSWESLTGDGAPHATSQAHHVAVSTDDGADAVQSAVNACPPVSTKGRHLHRHRAGRLAGATTALGCRTHLGISCTWQLSSKLPCRLHTAAQRRPAVQVVWLQSSTSAAPLPSPGQAQPSTLQRSHRPGQLNMSTVKTTVQGHPTQSPLQATQLPASLSQRLLW